MGTKTLCFNCKEHSTIAKNGNCFRCDSINIATCGSALRLPKKTDNNSWKKLTEIYFLQKKRIEKNGEKMVYFQGFGNNFFLHGCQRKNGFPMKLKEKITLDVLKNFELNYKPTPEL